MFSKKPKEFKEESKGRYDIEADEYDSGDRGYHARQLYPDVLRKLDKFSFNNLLDIGCGTGNLLSTISSKYDTEIAGVDISPKMLKIASEKLGSKADLREADSENLPFDDASFNMVMCTDSFHHYPHPNIVLNEIRRVLKPKGNILIADMSANTLFRFYLNLKLVFTDEGAFKIYSVDEIQKLLRNSKFINIECEMIPDKLALIATASK